MRRRRRTKIIFLVLIFLVLFPFKLKAGPAKSYLFGETLCQTKGFHCLKLTEKVVAIKQRDKNGQVQTDKNFLDLWPLLWPDPQEREIIMKINRLNIALSQGMILAVPNEMSDKTLMDFSPFELKIDPISHQPILACRQEIPDGQKLLNQLLLEQQIKSKEEKILVFDPQLLAWAAYNESGELVRWGPAVGGKNYCPDTKQICRTPEGEFKVTLKAGKNYRSHKFPAGCKDNDCAPMPYAMIFYTDGCAFHASAEVPGKPASHGCVRLFYDDAKWLNENFVQIGTKIIIKPYVKK